MARPAKRRASASSHAKSAATKDTDSPVRRRRTDSSGGVASTSPHEHSRNLKLCIKRSQFSASPSSSPSAENPEFTPLRRRLCLTARTTPRALLLATSDTDANTQSAGANLHSLPYELHVHIASYLDFPEDLVQLSAVSRYCYRVAHDPRLWQYLDLSQYPHAVTNRVLRSLVLSHFGPTSRAHFLRMLSSLQQSQQSASSSSSVPSSLVDAATSYLFTPPGVRGEIAAISEQFTQSQEDYETVEDMEECRTQALLNARLPGLKSLFLDGAIFLTGSVILELLPYFSHLERLTILDCQEFTPNELEQLVSVCLCRLKVLEVNCSVNDYSLSTICAGALQLRAPCDTLGDEDDDGTMDDDEDDREPMIAPLKTIYLRGNVKNISQIGVTKLVHAFPLLETLDLAFCENVTSAAVIEIARNCHHLKRLSLRFCHQVTNEAIYAIGEHCRNMESLDLSGLSEITDDPLYTLTSFKKLRILSVESCKEITHHPILHLLGKLPQLETVNSGITDPEVRLHPKSNAKVLLSGSSFLSTILPYAIDENASTPTLYLLIGKHRTGRWGDFRPSLLTRNRARALANACKHFVKMTLSIVAEEADLHAAISERGVGTAFIRVGNTTQYISRIDYDAHLSSKFDVRKTKAGRGLITKLVFVTVPQLFGMIENERLTGQKCSSPLLGDEGTASTSSAATSAFHPEFIRTFLRAVDQGVFANLLYSYNMRKNKDPSPEADAMEVDDDDDADQPEV